jgi:hypothetical protein
MSRPKSLLALATALPASEVRKNFRLDHISMEASVFALQFCLQQILRA